MTTEQHQQPAVAPGGVDLPPSLHDLFTGDSEVQMLSFDAFVGAVFMGWAGSCGRDVIYESTASDNLSLCTDFQRVIADKDPFPLSL